jgi:hypothetical protein
VMSAAAAAAAAAVAERVAERLRCSKATGMRRMRRVNVWAAHVLVLA